MNAASCIAPAAWLLTSLALLSVVGLVAIAVAAYQARRHAADRRALAQIAAAIHNEIKRAERIREVVL